MSNKETIYWSITDEAPFLATQAFLPVVQAFLGKSGISVETKNISLVARILAIFPEYLTPEQREDDALLELGKMVCESDSNIIKLPNISASIPQLKAAILELQQAGFAIPDYPEDGSKKEILEKYNRVKGSAVNPVIRMGNADRRVPLPVKKYAQKHPHSNGVWNKMVKTRVASMEHGDFYETEESFIVKTNSKNAKIVCIDESGVKTVLKESIALEKEEIVDVATMSKEDLQEFFKTAMKTAKDENLLLSVHLKATMMKVSDPVMFGSMLEVYFAPVFEKYSKELKSIGVESSNGLGDFYKKIEALSDSMKNDISKEILSCMEKGPSLAMVNSDKGITNFHVPSDIIIDASMPSMIRNSGCMWNRDGFLQQTLAVIPDRSYAGVYEATIEYCKKNGAFDPSTMGSVSNVGLMARKAEEYGSHATTVIAQKNGFLGLEDENGELLIKKPVSKGSIFRICRTKDDAVKDWVHLAVERSKKSGEAVVFWLDEKRAHDRAIKAKVESFLFDNKAISIMDPIEACVFTMDEISKGRNIIAATGNILRDYLTDLFPILEVGTSAKMLSIVPLMAGGGLYETGAGGSAPKHVQQFLAENHLRWDSLGEFLALAISLEQVALKTEDKKVEKHARILSSTLNDAITKYLDEEKGPTRKVSQADNRTSQFYLSLYWAEFLSSQKKDEMLSKVYSPLYEKLLNNEKTIVSDMILAQGSPVDIGGYYHVDEKKLKEVMRPSLIFNEIIDSFC